VGEILFGVSVIRAGVFSKIAACLFMIGFVPMTLLGVFPDIIVAIGSVMAGVGIIWWSKSLWSLAKYTTE